MADKKFVIKKVLDNVVNFFCDAIYVYIIDKESKIHCVSKYDYSRKYIGVGHFGKPSSNTKSANNTIKYEPQHSHLLQ